MDHAARPGDAAVEELVVLIVDRLIPAVGWYRDQLAHLLDTGLPGLAVLEEVRRRPTTAARTALRTGMTPSAATKVIRRLEALGHVRRVPSGTHEQRLLVELVPHEQRDVVLGLVRDHVRATAEHIVSALGLHHEPYQRIAAETLVQVALTLGREACG